MGIVLAVSKGLEPPPPAAPQGGSGSRRAGLARRRRSKGSMGPHDKRGHKPPQFPWETRQARPAPCTPPGQGQEPPAPPAETLKAPLPPQRPSKGFGVGLWCGGSEPWHSSTAVVFGAELHQLLVLAEGCWASANPASPVSLSGCAHRERASPAPDPAGCRTIPGKRQTCWFIHCQDPRGRDPRPRLSPEGNGRV